MNETLAFIGLRPIFVTDFDQEALILRDHGLILVNADADLADVVDWALRRHVEHALDDAAPAATA